MYMLPALIYNASRQLAGIMMLKNVIAEKQQIFEAFLKFCKHQN